jgi:two-component system, OmpR family, response regulator TctD
MRLLLVEDDSAMRATLERALGRAGMQVVSCGSGLQALEHWPQVKPDVVCLDLSLPDLDGLHVLERAREKGWDAPVLVLTARATVGDRIMGLKTGADDYLPKPFDLDELEVRLRTLVRRRAVAPAGAAGPAVLSASAPSSAKQAESARDFAGLSFDASSGAFYYQGTILELTPRESALLKVLHEKVGFAVSKEQLLRSVFASDSNVGTDAIEVLAYRLRKKLADTNLVLHTLRGLGYVLRHE